MIVSPSMSLVAAGVASGICFILLTSLRKGKATAGKDKKRERATLDDSRCGCCFKPFLLERGVRCNDCGARSCRKACSRWDTSEYVWHCLFCHQHRSWLKRKERWFDSFGGNLDQAEFHRFFNTAKSRVHIAGLENATASTSTELPTEGQEEVHTMETIREFIERIIERVIGNVDDTPIHQLYEHPEYQKFLEKYVAPLSSSLARLAVALQLSLTNKPGTDSPAMAHSALREIIGQVIEEARKLPGFGDSVNSRREAVEDGRNVVENSYEDLLATAILNKVVEQFQRERVDGNKNIIDSKIASTVKPALCVEGNGQSYSRIESITEECGASCPKHAATRQQPLPLMLEERIEEITTYTSEENQQDTDSLSISNTHRVPFPELGMDIIDPFQETFESQEESETAHVDMVSPVESWEENWLFQKKKIQLQADPVAMLVPNSSTEFKALIGDKDAEDTSDLSECSSTQSDEEIEKELLEAISNVQPRDPEQIDLPNSNNGLSEQRFATEDFEKVEFVNYPVSRAESKRVSRGNDENETDVSRQCGNECFELIDEKVHVAESEGSERHGSKEPGTENALVEGAVLNGGDRVSNQNGRGKDGERACTNAMVSINNKSSEARKSVNNNNVTKREEEEEESATEMPRTPACTPTLASTAHNLGSDSNAEGLSLSDSVVLNSLERAKEKLSMTVLEHRPDSRQEEKINFHAGNEDAQQESEYTEHYDTAIQRHLDSLTKLDTLSAIDQSEPPTLSEDSKCEEVSRLTNREPSEQRLGSEKMIQLSTPPRPGSIAEREHKKWENAPPIENNPYSEESIQRRLWERQYSRRSSDIPGAQTELPNSTDLDVVLAPREPDMKRFGRDYYINDSRNGRGDKGGISGTSASSRPSSSLSQRSGSTGPDQQFQEETRDADSEIILNSAVNVKSKVAQWQKNNIETNNQSTGNNLTKISESERIEEKCLRRSGMPVYCSKNWDNQRVEEMLESQRKNSKNEINAKLNNQENSYDSGIALEARRNSEENRKKIQRIDLKAYGFENEIFSNGGSKSAKPSQQRRVVNRLNLASFGYDGGLRRAQSNNHLDSTVKDQNEFKPSKLGPSSYRKFADMNDLIDSGALRDHDLAKSTEALNKLYESSGGGLHSLKSAKSVPNIARFECYLYSSNREAETTQRYNAQNLLTGSNEASKFGRKGSQASENNQTENGSNDSPEESDCQYESSSLSTHSEREEQLGQLQKKKLPLPSVKKLAQAFSKQPTDQPRRTKSNGVSQERSSTPEVQIVETPKQMHSLTARSLSKKFREGLRQIPNKMTSPPASHGNMEQPARIPENQTEHAQTKPEDPQNDIDVILPGKLKSNIIFWEQLQRKRRSPRLQRVKSIQDISSLALSSDSPSV